MYRQQFNLPFMLLLSAGALAALSTNSAARADTPPDVSTSPSPAVAVPTTPTIRYSATTLTDKVVRHLGQTADRLTFRVTNDTGSPVQYDFDTGQQIDLTIVDSTGATVWDYGKSRTFQPLITHHTLKKGQTLTYTVLWDRRDQGEKPVSPGVYTVTAALKNTPRLVVSQTATIDPNREAGDPTNVTLATSPDSVRTDNGAGAGGSQQNDIAPSISAKTTITVAPAS